MDPITDIFRTMHVTAFGQHRLEATAPWGLIQEKQTEEKVTPSGKKDSPTDLAHFAILAPNRQPRVRIALVPDFQLNERTTWASSATSESRLPSASTSYGK